MHHIKGGSLVLGVLFMLSPIIKTFQNNFADNTSYALTFVMILIHLGWRDYGYVFTPEYSTLLIFQKK